MNREKTVKGRQSKRQESLWRRSWRAFKEGFIYLLPWLSIPTLIGLIIALPQILEPLWPPPRPPVLVFFGRLSQIAVQPAFLAGLLAALIGFGMEVWKRQLDRRREQEQVLGEVDRLRQLLRKRRWNEALRTYRDFSGRRGLAWGDPEVQKWLAEVWERDAPAHLREFHDLERFEETRKNDGGNGSAEEGAEETGAGEEGGPAKKVGKQPHVGREQDREGMGPAKVEPSKATEAQVTNGRAQAEPPPAPVDDQVAGDATELSPSAEPERTEEARDHPSPEVPAQEELSENTDQANAIEEQPPVGEQKAPAAKKPAVGPGRRPAPPDSETEKSRERWWQQTDRTPREITQTLLWASQNLEEEYDRATEMMVSLLTPETITEVKPVLEQDEARDWLRDSRFEGPLEALEKDSEAKKWAGALLEQRSKPRIVRIEPLLWSVPRFPDSPAVQELLKTQQATFNPFGPERAEQDPSLPAYGVKPSWWNRVQVPEPTLIWGSAGSGKTATALLLAYDWFKGNDLFPAIYTAVSPFLLPYAALDHLGELLARALVEYLALAPSAFNEAELPQQVAMAQLLLLRLGPRDRLGKHLARAGLSCEQGIGARLLSQIDHLGPAKEDLLEYRNADILDLLRLARPGRRWGIVYLLDPAVEQLRNDAAWRLAPLLNLAEGLSRVGVYLKVFLPKDIRLPVRWDGEEVQITWSSEELEEMLQQRLEEAIGPEGLSKIMSRQACEGYSQVSKYLADLAKGSPRRLVQLGNRLLELAAQDKEKQIQPEHLKELSSWIGKYLRGD